MTTPGPNPLHEAQRELGRVAGAEGALMSTPAGMVDRYGIALLLIALTIGVNFFLGGWRAGAVLAVALGGGTLLFVLTASDAGSRMLLVVRAFVGVLVLVAALAMLSGGSELNQALVLIAGGALALVAPIAIARRLRRHTTVSAHTVMGALCLYLLSGLFFAYLYAFVDLVAGPAFAQKEVVGLPDTVYFSFVTLATVGYGDLTPAIGLVRMLAISEAVGGQLYLVAGVALLVGNLGRARDATRAAAWHGATGTGGATGLASATGDRPEPAEGSAQR